LLYPAELRALGKCTLLVSLGPLAYSKPESDIISLKKPSGG